MHIGILFIVACRVGVVKMNMLAFVKTGES